MKVVIKSKNEISYTNLEHGITIDKVRFYGKDFWGVCVNNQEKESVHLIFETVVPEDPNDDYDNHRYIQWGSRLTKYYIDRETKLYIDDVEVE